MFRAASVLLVAWRRTYRLVLIIAWILIVIPWGVFARTFLPDVKSRNAMRKIIRIWGLGLSKIMGVKIRLCSESASPESVDGLIVANHQGYLDIIVHAAIFGSFFTPKSDIRKWPFFGWYVDCTYPIWINRRSAFASSESMKNMRECLTRGFPVVIYPEATSRDTRKGLLPFKPLLLESVVNTKLQIHPFVFCYWVPDGERYPNYEVGDKILQVFWQSLGNSRTEFLGCILPSRTAGTLDRKTLANGLHEEMENTFLRVWEEIDGMHNGQSAKN
ncbi:MAG: 1-acyl-sn-glycerol-3-phosphate acyltransferase [Victivallaceae bacterium]|nr:1-acyl-sn-glycerol-3-phosphate acyltransferase [Victivallaceae bacterium]